MGENSRPNDKLVEKPAENNETETIYYLDDGSKRKSEKFPEKLRRKFACLGLTWPGLILLLILCVVLLIFIIVIIVLAVKLALYQKHSANICKTPACLRTSANIVEKMNQNMDPCENFYNFTCGKWNEEEKNEYGIATSGFEKSLEQNLRNYYGKLRDLLNTLPFSTNSTSVEWKMKHFYMTCMNTESIESAGINPLKRIILQLYGWNVLGDFEVSQWDNNDIVRTLHVKYGVDPFFKPVVTMDDKVAKIEILPSGFGLPRKKYYFREYFDRVVKAYKSLLHDIAVLFDATGPSAKSFANEVFYFEKRLAHIYPDVDYRTRLRYPQELITVGELQSWSPQIDWMEYLNAAFPSFIITDATIVLANKTYLQEVSKLFSSADNPVMNNYMIWMLVREYLPYLPKKFQTVLDNFQAALTGATQGENRWEFCIKEVEKLFPIGTAALFVDNFVSQDEIKSVKSYFKEMSETFLTRINNYNWMDDVSKQRTKQKVAAVSFYKQFPSGVNSTKMAQHYKNLRIMKSDFFENIITRVNYHTLLSVELLKGQTNVEWYMLHYYEHRTPFVTLSRKYLVIPPYLLQEPVFDSKQFASLNFGSLGWLMARALIQGFENADVLNKDWYPPSFLPTWWNNYTCENYEKHQTCVIEEYFEFTLHIPADDEEINYDPITTEDENMADIGGLTLAYDAFINWASKHKEELYLPAFPDISKEQLFFISFGQSLCAEMKPQSLSNELDGNTFSPDQIRVNGTVSQIPEFSYAFSCSSSSQMNSEHKCTTW